MDKRVADLTEEQRLKRNATKRAWNARKKADKLEEMRKSPDEDYSTELSLEEPEVTATTPETLSEKAKAWFADLKDPKPAPKAKQHKNKFFRSKSEIIVRALIVLLERGLAKYDMEYVYEGKVIRLLPDEEQASNIINPLLNIMDRHAPMASVNPDAEDVANCLTAIGMYAWDTRTNLKLIAYIKAMEAARDQHQSQVIPPLEGVPTSNGPAVFF